MLLSCVKDPYVLFTYLYYVSVFYLTSAPKLTASQYAAFISANILPMTQYSRDVYFNFIIHEDVCNKDH